MFSTGLFRTHHISWGLLAAALSAAPLAAAAETDPWSGPYAGISGGVQIDQAHWLTNSVGPGGVFPVDTITSGPDLADKHGRIGLFGGWNLRLDQRWVAGIDGDIGITAAGDSKLHSLPGVDTLVTPAIDSVTLSQKWDASIAGRLGVLFDHEQTLLYGSAGLALRGFDIKANCPSGSDASWCGVPESTSLSKTRISYSLGAGAETKIMDGWTGRLDYRYANFSHQSLTLLGGNNYGVDQFGATASLSSHIVTIGIAYHFGM